MKIIFNFCEDSPKDIQTKLSNKARFLFSKKKRKVFFWRTILSKGEKGFLFLGKTLGNA
jgi:hypothetical protein